MSEKIKGICFIDYHRNGVSGESFHTVVFNHNKQTLVGIVFEAPKHCAVIGLSKTVCGMIDTENKWRGDEFEKPLRTLISESEKKQEGE